MVAQWYSSRVMHPEVMSSIPACWNIFASRTWGSKFKYRWRSQFLLVIIILGLQLIFFSSHIPSTKNLVLWTKEFWPLNSKMNSLKCSIKNLPLFSWSHGSSVVQLKGSVSQGYGFHSCPLKIFFASHAWESKFKFRWRSEFLSSNYYFGASIAFYKSYSVTKKNSVLRAKEFWL